MIDLMSKEEYDQVLVHEGFLQIYMGLRSTIIGVIKSFQPNDWIVSGHSLGSALATFALYDLMIHGQKIHSAYIVASPRIGNPFWVKAFNIALDLQKVNGKSPMYRIANSADPVTQIPPAILGNPGKIAQYLHVGDCSCTFEHIPANVSISTMPSNEFMSWVHSYDTYTELAAKVFNLKRLSVE
jgi:predicted lipase